MEGNRVYKSISCCHQSIMRYPNSTISLTLEVESGGRLSRSGTVVAAALKGTDQTDAPLPGRTSGPSPHPRQLPAPRTPHLLQLLPPLCQTSHTGICTLGSVPASVRLRLAYSIPFPTYVLLLIIHVSVDPRSGERLLLSLCVRNRRGSRRRCRVK